MKRNFKAKVKKSWREEDCVKEREEKLLSLLKENEDLASEENRYLVDDENEVPKIDCKQIKSTKKEAYSKNIEQYNILSEIFADYWNKIKKYQDIIRNLDKKFYFKNKKQAELSMKYSQKISAAIKLLGNMRLILFEEETIKKQVKSFKIQKQQILRAIEELNDHSYEQVLQIQGNIETTIENMLELKTEIRKKLDFITKLRNPQTYSSNELHNIFVEIENECNYNIEQLESIKNILGRQAINLFDHQSEIEDRMRKEYAELKYQLKNISKYKLAEYQRELINFYPNELAKRKKEIERVCEIYRQEGLKNCEQVKKREIDLINLKIEVLQLKIQSSKKEKLKRRTIADMNHKQILKKAAKVVTKNLDRKVLIKETKKIHIKKQTQREEKPLAREKLFAKGKTRHFNRQEALERSAYLLSRAKKNTEESKSSGYSSNSARYYYFCRICGRNRISKYRKIHNNSYTICDPCFKKEEGKEEYENFRNEIDFRSSTND